MKSENIKENNISDESFDSRMSLALRNELPCDECAELEFCTNDIWNSCKFAQKYVEVRDNAPIDLNEIFNIESKNSNWELTFPVGCEDIDFVVSRDKINLHYVPEDDYCEKDITINLPIEHFYDLVKLLKRIEI